MEEAANFLDDVDETWMKNPGRRFSSIFGSLGK
jgi:hypothetical protein